MNTKRFKNSIKNLYISDKKKGKQLTNMRNSLQKLGTNMQNYNKKILNCILNRINIKPMLNKYLKNLIKNLMSIIKNL